MLRNITMNNYSQLHKLAKVAFLDTIYSCLITAPCCHRLPGQTDKPTAQQESWITEKNLSVPLLSPERGIPPVSPTDSPSRSSPACKLEVVLLTNFLWHGKDMNHILRAPGSPVSLQCRTSEPGLSLRSACAGCTGVLYILPSVKYLKVNRCE